MPLRAKLLLLILASSGTALDASSRHFAIHAEEAGSWPAIFGSIGLRQGPEARLTVIRPGSPPMNFSWADKLAAGHILILEGDSGTARQFGFVSQKRRVVCRSIVDARSPDLRIIWEKAEELPFFDVPANARIFATERWAKAPVLAGFVKGKGAVLWVATSPGAKGFERFPYLLHALTDLGLRPPYRSNRLWAFFDSSYRTRVDVDYFAERWRKSGISALHVAAWHYFEPDAGRDAFLRRLVEACHRRGILVYAWLELPHVSEQFWLQHPEWRERTAAGQDAHLDWRKLMNLQNPECALTVMQGTNALMQRFDWDGVNLAELYFESLEGVANPARFTPMNGDVRNEYRQKSGLDPMELFGTANHPGMGSFLEYRAGLARRMQSDWLDRFEELRRKLPHLDLVLTHVDDRFDTRMRELIGADAAAILPRLEQSDFTFLIEDPATVWHLGPERYPEIAKRYAPLTKRAEKLAIDINVVERYQDVYPTKQQTGTELLQLLHLSSAAFQRVALYFENSLLPADLELIPASSATVTRDEAMASKRVLHSPRGVGIDWEGGAIVNGQPWPYHDGKTLWLPAGPQVIEPSFQIPALRLLDFNGDLRSAVAKAGAIELSYSSSARAIAILSEKPVALEVDGLDTKLELAGPNAVLLPRGQHLVTLQVQ